MKQAFIDLLKVKSLVTLAVIGTMVFMAITSQIEPVAFMTVASSVITYYFTKKENGIK